MIFDLTIAGVPKLLKAGSFRMSQVANGSTTVSFAIISQDRSYRPALDDEVIIEVNGTRIFGGIINRPVETGFNPSGIITYITATDFNDYAERRYVFETIPAGTLKAALQVIEPYLTPYGVTLDPAQVNGPDLPDRNYEDRHLVEVLDEFSLLTLNAGEQYIWNIDHFKVLSMVQPSTVAAPFTVTEGPGTVILWDVEVEQTRENFANRVILNVPQRSQANRIENFTATAAQSLFTLWYSVVPPSPTTITVTTGAGTSIETVSETPGAADWLLTRTPLTQAQDTLTRNLGGLSAGDIVSFTFNGQLRARFISSDATSIAAIGPWERTVVVEDLPSLQAGQDLCDAYLLDSLPLVKTVKYRTLELGLMPGQSQTVNLPARNVVDDGFIHEVVTRDWGPYELLSEVTIVTGEVKRPNWRDFWRKLDKIGEGGAMAGGPGGAGANVGQGPGLPFKSVQFNRAGTFGGDADFIYHESENSVVCGGGGSDITAAAFESCQVFGYNNHIT